MSYSREEKDIFGNTYIQHYNDDGTKAGWSTPEKDLLGNDYVQHHNEDYTKAGWSTPEKDFLGNDYTQHHNEDYTKAGWSTPEKDFLGSDYTQHHNEDYAKAGWSTPEKDFLKNDYTQHRNQDYSSADGVRHGHTHTSRSRTGSKSNWSQQTTDRIEDDDTADSVRDVAYPGVPGEPISGVVVRASARGDGGGVARFFPGIIGALIGGIVSVIPAFILSYFVYFFWCAFEFLILGKALAATGEIGQDNIVIGIIALSTICGFFVGVVNARP